MPFFNSNDRKAKSLMHGVHFRTFWGEQMLLSHVSLEPHAEVPLHSHPHEQAGIVLEGEMVFTIEGEGTQLMRPGDMYIAPGNVRHAVTAGASGCIALDIFSPVREEYKFTNE